MRNINPIHQSPEQIHGATMSANLHGMRKDVNKNAAETNALLGEIRDKEMPKEMAVSLKGVSVVTIKGDRGERGIPGHTPTEEEIIKILLPLIPDPIPGEDGHTPTNEEILALIRPLIPEVADGHTPTDEELLDLIRPLIPEPIKGEDGSPDTPDDVVEKVNQSTKKIDSKQVEGLSDVIQTVDNLGKFSSGGKGGGGRAPIVIQGAGTKLSDHVTALNFSTNLTAVYSGNGVVTITGSGGGTPAGSDTQVQFNDGGAFGGDAGLTYNKTTNKLTVGSVAVDDEAYDATNWNGSLEVPTKNAVRDKIEAMLSSSGITRAVTVTSGNYTAGSSASTDYVYLIAGAHTTTLPSASGNSNRYTFKNNHSVAVTINRAGTDTIDGATSVSLAPEESIDLISNGTDAWSII